MNEAPTLELRDIRIAWDGHVLVEDFLVDVGKGRKVAMSGASGSGKTTLLKCILGLAWPDAGDIYIQGDKLDMRNVWSLRQQIAYVPQEPQLYGNTAQEFLHRPFTFKANAHLSWDIAQVHEFMDRFYLPHKLLSEPTDQLSGGEKQRIAFISAILLNRPILLLDEPTSALDKAGKNALAEYLNQRADLTVLAVSHEETMLSICDQVVELSTAGVAS